MSTKKNATAAAAPAKKKGRKPAPENESKNEKFQRLAAERMTKAIKSLRVIGNLGSANYERTAEQVAKMITTLTNEVTALNAKLDPSKSPTAKESLGFQF